LGNGLLQTRLIVNLFLFENAGTTNGNKIANCMQSFGEMGEEAIQKGKLLVIIGG
jgi:hypothetical protein